MNRKLKALPKRFISRSSEGEADGGQTERERDLALPCVADAWAFPSTLGRAGARLFDSASYEQVIQDIVQKGQLTQPSPAEFVYKAS